MKSGRALLGVALGLVLALCVAAAPRPALAQQEVTVYAAASLKNALDAIVAKWQGEGGGKAKISYAASSALAKQIENGAPADIFMSADLDWMDYLANRNLIKADSRRNLLGNRIVLVTATDSKIGAIKIGPGFPLAQSLGVDGRLAMGEVNSVPAGKYGKAALEALGVWPSVATRVAQAESVRAALLLVSRGEAPLGIVYRSDAVSEPAVRVVGTFPDSTHAPIVYPLAVLKSGDDAPARAFAALLRGPAARAVFERYGFSAAHAQTATPVATQTTR